jgi:glycosyltransferase involved in cell wall biosynthesis
VNKPTVSVVIAYFNGSAWIERALDSVYSQTVPPQEVIIVDDGSTSEQLEFLGLLQAKFGFQIISQKNAGQSAARNLGVKATKSEFFCILDQDDFFLPRHIEVLIHGAQTQEPVFAFSYGDLIRVSPSGDVISRSCVNVNTQHPLTDIRIMIRHNMYILPSATMIRRSAFLDVGGFDENLRGYEDDDLFVRLFLRGFTNTFIPEPVTAWTVNPGSTSFSEDMARSRFVYLRKLMSNHGEFGLFPVEGVFKIIFSRFAMKLADDVIGSVLLDSQALEERRERLSFFWKLTSKSKEIPFFEKFPFLASAFFLLFTEPRKLKGVLSWILRNSDVLAKFRFRFLREFLDRYSSGKEFV